MKILIPKDALALEVSHIRKRFTAQQEAVSDLNFSIPRGEIFGLLGPNGAGKSTTINMIAGVTAFKEGTIRVMGFDNVKDFRITRRILGVVHQETISELVFPVGKALEIHSGYYGCPFDKKWFDRLIDTLDLGPHMNKKMLQLSGGMKRRFMVAKALVHKPKLLILDEPTAGVDIELRRSLWEFVRDINREGTTVLLTTHYLEEAEKMCDRIGILNFGRLVALDRTQNLLQHFSDKKLLVRFKTAVQEIPGELGNCVLQRDDDGRTWKFSVHGADQLYSILTSLKNAKLPIEDFETVKNDLEDVFVKLTGIE